MYQDGFYGAEIYVSTVGFFFLPAWIKQKYSRQKGQHWRQKRDLLSPQQCLAAKPVSIRPLFAVPRNPTTKFKTPSAPPSSLSSYDLRLWQRGRPGLSVPCQVRSFLSLDLSGFLRWLVFCSPPHVLLLLFYSLLFLYLCTLRGFGWEIPACPRGSVQVWVEPVPPSHHHVGDKRSGSR